MKHPVALLGAGVLILLLGTVAPTLAQERHEQEAQAPKQAEQAKQEKQAKPAKQQQGKTQQNQAKQQQQGQQNQQKEQKQAKGQENQQKVQQQQATSMSRQEGVSPRPQRSPQDEAKRRAEPPVRLSARGQGRIPDDRFRSNFGGEHRFRIGSPRMVDGYSRFQYGGFWFGFVQPWPDDWYYTDDVYIDYVDGEYYMFNPYYPGVRIAICVVL